MRRYAVLLVALLSVFVLVGSQVWPADGAELPRRVRVAMLARDREVEPTPAKPQAPPPGPGYCGASQSGPPAPANAIFGLLTIGGSPAPAGTLVTLTFDGKPGPSAYTARAGGYRVDYSAGGQGHTPPCINQVGTELGLLVDGTLVSSGVAVGPDAGLAFRFDVALP